MKIFIFPVESQGQKHISIRNYCSAFKKISVPMQVQTFQRPDFGGF